jgi:D-3-phosphoglycerate dehydrogenase
MVVDDPVEALILDLLEWLDGTPRPYVDVMEAWRTSCPRLPVWEEANRRGFLLRRPGDGGGLVSTSPRGRTHLRLHRPVVAV